MRNQSQRVLITWPARFSLGRASHVSPNKPDKSRRAMTLVEVMMAVFVLALVFGGVISSMVRAASMTRDSKIIYRETAILNDEIERMRGKTFDGLKTHLADKESRITEAGLAGAYTYRLKRASDTGTDPIKITLTISPESMPQRSVSLVTYISSEGLIKK